MQWYVVQSHALAENKAQFHLKRQGFEVYLPRYLKRRRHARKTDWVPAPLFPRYMFLHMDTERSRWLSIRSTIGVSQLVCQGNRPTPVPDEIVESIRERESETGLIDIRREAQFKKGDAVQVMDGPLCERVGLFECESDEDRVIVLLDLLGREVKVKVPIEAVAAYQ
ncbi:MAG: transcriptional activator RfaH [Alphaproteobacteria bacterium]|nr:transcriptional activator RfaH [Alphaproteobacteria bacterium]